MYYVYYNRTSGNLVDITTDSNIVNDPNLVMETRSGDMPDLAKMDWDPCALDFVAKHTSIFSKLEFLTKFTLAERIQARSSTDPIVIDIMQMLDIAEFINTQDPNTIQSLGYLAQIGILTPERMSEILNG